MFTVPIYYIKNLVVLEIKFSLKLRKILKTFSPKKKILFLDYNNNNYSFYTHFGTSMRLQNTVLED